jgi:hypothetical protein
MQPSEHVANARGLLQRWDASGQQPDTRDLSLAVQRLAVVPATAKEHGDAVELASEINYRLGKAELSSMEQGSPIKGDQIQAHLSSVASGSTRYGDAQQLLTKLSQDEKSRQDAEFAAQAKANAEQDRRAKIAAAQAKTAHENDTGPRIAYAKLLENNMLERGMSVDITVLGPKATILKYKYPLVSKAFVYKVEHDTDFLQVVQGLGFQKVIYTDGYNETWWTTFNQK